MFTLITCQNLDNINPVNAAASSPQANPRQQTESALAWWCLDRCFHVSHCACSLGSVSWNSDYLQLRGPELKVRPPSDHQGPIHTPLKLLLALISLSPSTSFLLFFLCLHFHTSIPPLTHLHSLFLSLRQQDPLFFFFSLYQNKGAQEQDECAAPPPFALPNPDSGTCIY